MGGQDAVRGFEYQFLRTLEYALDLVGDDDTDVTGVRIEGTIDRTGGPDPEIVDFALVDDEGNLTIAQVKSGRPGSSLSALDTFEVLVRLLKHPARRYLLITNRAATTSLRDLSALIDDQQADLREEVLTLLAQSRMADELRDKDEEFWQRLRCTKVVLDLRDVEQVREQVRDRVRAVRHRVAPSTIGWDVTGLLTGYLVSEVMARAASPDASELTVTELTDALGADPEELRGLLRERNWAVHVTAGPRATDIARPKLLDQMARYLSTPVRGDTAPVCLLTGLSGIGKSSMAAAWADEHADAYAAILWVDASGPVQLEASFAVIAAWFHSQGVLTDAETGLPVQQRVFVALARTARPWLMVFDNCADQAVLRGWIPHRGRGHTIVTSTDQTGLAGAHMHTVPVPGMTDAEATRLLARRILGQRTPTDEEWGVLGGMAAWLNNWPLALELAAAYLVGTLPEETGDLARRVAQYERLLKRSMSDPPSVPEGYPQTVVGAVSLTWQRIVERETPAERLASLALRSAAFLASRQIPLHLLLACWTTDSWEFSGPLVYDRLPTYLQDDPPIGEVLRAVHRDSLVRADEAFPLPGPTRAEPAVRLGYTITMNDIVQFTVRGLVDRENLTHQVLVRTAFYVQAWMSHFAEHGRMRLALGLRGHGIETSEHAIDLGAADKNVALLWGNTAGLLGYLDEWSDAARYLVAELAWVDSTDQPDLLIRIQTVVGLATAHYNLADPPRDAAERVVALMEDLLGDVPAALELDREVVGRTVAAACSVVLSLRLRGADHPRLAALQSALEDILKMAPHDETVGHLVELRRLHSLIGEGRNAEVRLIAKALLSRWSSDHPDYLQVLRMLAEACVHLRDWAAARSTLARFTDAADEGMLRRFDLALLLRNVGIDLVSAMLEQEQPAFDLFRTLDYIASLCDRHSVAIQAGDRDVIAVFRALRAYLDQDKSACIEWLDQVDLTELTIVERGGMTTIMYRLLRNWTAPPSILQNETRPFETPQQMMDKVVSGPRSPALDTVVPCDDSDIATIVLGCKAESAPAHALSLSQVRRAGGRVPRESLEIVVESCLALDLLGFPTRIAETALAIADRDSRKQITDPFLPTLDNASRARASRVPHYTVLMTTSQHLVDPVLPQLAAIRPLAATRPLHRFSAVLPFQGENSIHVIVREEVMVAYQHLGTYKAQHVATTLLSPEQRAACATNAFFVALHTVFTLSATSGERVAELTAVHRQLDGLLISPDSLADRR
ncbi:hypothetical protein [Saccharothrix sp. Mg75]|uniref:hypothetical protein n=1 Tax=Saccharothrix sp. Mg75 TaxID=3445357 RepID=UPI003EE88F94